MRFPIARTEFAEAAEGGIFKKQNGECRMKTPLPARGPAVRDAFGPAFVDATAGGRPTYHAGHSRCQRTFPQGGEAEPAAKRVLHIPIFTSSAHLVKSSAKM